MRKSSARQLTKCRALCRLSPVVLHSDPPPQNSQVPHAMPSFAAPCSMPAGPAASTCKSGAPSPFLPSSSSSTL
ncbi:hypothetical protein DFH08DRAFT_975706 [Mycena albidolilacea]|uniref:Uncharacterized protein n=1 Tax=Mycena albidolilacea TaxID=1033008 RepID=A0AAD6Z4R0_9AGAR|nr:hypothetical protein DFH08DRAFT_975706 [Mycena albidolilacea]